MATTVPLPGVFFEADPGPLTTVLPRMDIAGFVGFAAAGPLHTPVPVEDDRRFRELFGAEAPLAWDADHGRLETARLAPAVAGFFRNGGRRCWVVRVAGDGARRHRFPLPQLVRADTDAIAQARARSVGSWADALIVETVLVRTRLPLFANGGEPLAIAAAGTAPRYQLDVRSLPADARPGDLLEITLPGDASVLYVFVEAIISRERGARLIASRGYWRQLTDTAPAQPPAAARWLVIDEEDGEWHYQRWRAGSPGPAMPTVHLLRFELHAGLPERTAFRLGNLAFGRAHPRFWGHLPTDEELFGSSIGRPVPLSRPEIDAFVAEATVPRFPLVAPEPTALADGYLPLGMPLRARSNLAMVPLEDGRNVLERDGLERFSASLFLDADLAGIGLSSLLREAEHKYYLQQRPLSGLHSLLPIEEVTLIAIPDAGHRAWDHSAPPAAPLLPAPDLDPLPEASDEHGRHLVSWSRVAGATAYLLQSADHPEFAQPTTLYSGAETEARVILANACPQPRYVRVRAFRQQQASAWSQTRGHILPPEDFLACDAPPIIELRLRAIPLALENEDTLLRWAADDATPLPVDAEVELEEADEWDFFAPVVHHFTARTEATVGARRDGVQHFRARLRLRGIAGPWSNTVSVRPIGRREATLRPVADYDDGDLLAVHRALIRFAAARGDLLATLTLPHHFRRAHVETHIDALVPAAEPAPPSAASGIVAGVLPLAPGEAAALSYAALFHPWLITAPADGQAATVVGIDQVPPDGAMVGVMARLAGEEGAWLAPANRPLAGVLSLGVPLSIADRRALIAAHANPLAPEPRGFVAVDAQTLAAEGEERSISVRRLLILLRRLALREGASDVFEPNAVGFRAQVRGRFERLLSELFVRGAFAGDLPADGFRVVTDDSVNPRQSLDLGRFVVELHVAPSRPLAFLRVRLVQTGPGQLSVDEV